MASSQAGSFHPLPLIGHAPEFYLRHVKAAVAAGDVHARAAHKVEQYVFALTVIVQLLLAIVALAVASGHYR